MNTTQENTRADENRISIFGTHALDYYKKNYNVIPCRGKAPFFKGWQQYSKNKIDSNSFKVWLEDYDSLNIGLVLGAFSSTSAIDIDSDSHALIEVLPSSIVTIRGKKGEAPLFRYNPKVKRQKGCADCPVDLLTDNAVKIIAPSIHPDTNKEYTWKSKSLLDVSHDQLPLMPDNINEILKFVKENPKLFLTHVGKEENGNRNNRLVAMCARLGFMGEPKDVIIKSLKEYDLIKHKTPLFTSGETTAEKLYESVMRSIGKPPVWEVKTTKLLEEAKAEEDEELEDAANGELIKFGPSFLEFLETAPKTPPLPERGLLKDMCQIIQTYSKDEVFAGAVAGGLSMLSVIVGPYLNAVRHRSDCEDPLNDLNIYGNLYSVFLAPSATGKSFAFSFWEAELSDIVSSSRVNIENGFASPESLISALHDTHGAVLLKQDEAEKLFKSIDSRSVKGQGGLMATLNDIWSKAGGRVKLNKAMIRRSRGENHLEAVNPYLSIYGTLTPKTFQESINESMLGSGFFGRILFFYSTGGILTEEQKAEQNKVFKNKEQVLESIKTQVKYIMKRLYSVTESTYDNGLDKTKLNEPKIIPHTMEITEQLARETLVPLQLWMNKLQNDLKGHDALIMYVKRGMENILRIALLVEVSLIDWSKSKHDHVFAITGQIAAKKFHPISKEAVEYAVSLWKYNLNTFYNHVVNSMCENEYERLTENIVQYIGSFEDNGVMKRQVGQYFRRKKDTTNILRTLIEFKQIFVFKKGQRTYFVLDKYAKLFVTKHPLYKKQSSVSLNRV